MPKLTRRKGAAVASEPGQGESGTAVDFDHARAGFGAAWQRMLPTLTEANFQEWRNQRAWTAWKYAMHDASLPLPTQLQSGRSRCFCGVAIDNRGMDGHVTAAHLEMQ
jgi:hypothetical protein